MEEEMRGVELYHTLLSEMLDLLAAADAERSPGEGYGGMILIVRRSIGELRAAMEPFVDRDAEMAFFRGVWPVFYGKLFYYLLLHEFELDRLGIPAVALPELIGRGEREVLLFFWRNRDFWQYYKTGSSLIAEQFTRVYSDGCMFDPLCQVIDREWATVASYRAARGLAYEEYQHFLQLEKERAANPSTVGDRRRYEWKEGKTAAVEWIKAQVEAGSIYIDGKPATAVQLRADFEARYGEDLKDFDKLLYATDTRKKDQTPYLTKLMNAFVGRKERLGK
jgi:hypothetical protein